MLNQKLTFDTGGNHARPPASFEAQEFQFRKDDAMKKTQKFGSKKQQILRCPVCKGQLETKTTVRTRSGVTRTLNSEPGELTQCHHCKSMLEYGGLPGKLNIERARPERVRAFLDLMRETPSDMRLAELVAYVKKFRRMPPATLAADNGAVHFRYFFRS